MPKNNFIIDIDNFTGEFQSVAIVLCKTKVKYTAQCGGVACTHPVAEGFMISLGKFAQDFNDCAYLCGLLPKQNATTEQEQVAQDFDAYCKKYFADNKHLKYSISFDYERTNQAQESWLPIIIDGLFDDWQGTYFDNCKAILHTENCD